MGKSVVEGFRKLRHTAVPLPIKYGREFRRLFEFLQEHQHGSREEIEAYQWSRLEALVEYAYHHVPFYRSRFEDAGLHPRDIATKDDFRHIPVLYKEEVAGNIEALKSDAFRRLKPIPTVTSATTRDGLLTYRCQHLEDMRKAIVWRHYFNAGYRFREKRVQITTPIKFVRDPRTMPIDYSENCLLIDPRSVTAEHCPKIYERLKDFRPKLLHCQPSNAALLIDSFRQRNLAPFPIPIIYCLGEKLYPEYRKAIASFFGENIVLYYGNRENTASAGELEDRRMYVNSEYCYLEFETKGRQAAPGEPADIISTSLENYAFPLLRYCTEDLGVYHGYQEGALRNYEIIEVIGGRGKDLVLTKNGLVCPFVSIHFGDIGFDRYKRVQLEQVSMDELVLRLIPTPAFDDLRDRQLLEKSFTDYFQGQFKVAVEVVEEIPFTEAHKYKYVISDLALNYLRESVAGK